VEREATFRLAGMVLLRPGAEPEPLEALVTVRRVRGPRLLEASVRIGRAGGGPDLDARERALAARHFDPVVQRELAKAEGIARRSGA